MYAAGYSKLWYIHIRLYEVTFQKVVSLAYMHVTPPYNVRSFGLGSISVC